jgi:hypothetical protein
MRKYRKVDVMGECRHKDRMAELEKQLANSVPFEVLCRTCVKPHDGTCRRPLKFRTEKNCPLIPKGE